MSDTARSRSAPIGPQLTFHTRLRCEHAAAADARVWVATCLAERVPGDCLSDAMVVVGELVGYAAQHGRGLIEVRLAIEGGCLVGDVTDEGAEVDELPTGQVSDLVLVGALVDRWGITPDASHAWFEIGLLD